jgi:hypothetical protein
MDPNCLGEKSLLLSIAKPLFFRISATDTTVAMAEEKQYKQT